MGGTRTRPLRAWTAVEHRERGGGVHVHILAARCDLETGKSLNIAPTSTPRSCGPGHPGRRRPRESGSHPDDPARQCARGHRRGFNTLRALAQIRGETGSLETAPSATQSRRCSRSGIALGQPQICPWILGAFSGRGRGGGETRCVRRGVASGVRAIVSRARFRGPGWERREPLPGHPVRVPPGDRFAPDHRPGGRG